MSVQPSIPASTIISVSPSVIGAGGTPTPLNGLILSDANRVPYGSVFDFGSAAAVGQFFGFTSQEYLMAQVYFAGPENALVAPDNLLIGQYNFETTTSAWVHGASMASTALTTLQGWSGVLTLVVDGTTFTSGTINLATATSFSNAALLIEAGFATADATSTSSSIAGTTLTVAGTITGTFGIGQFVSGANVAPGTEITALGSGSGGAGTYTVSLSQTAAGAAIMAGYPAADAVFTGSISGTTLTVSAVAHGTVQPGQVLTAISSGAIIARTLITAQGSGSGGTGTYTVSNSQTVSSGVIAGGEWSVSFDSTSSSFWVSSNSISWTGTGAITSSVAYPTGAFATDLALAQASGALLSPGGVGATPAGGMAVILAATAQWAGFATTFEPPEADKLSFAQWCALQDDRFFYALWNATELWAAESDTGTSLAQIIAAGYGGTIPIHAPVNGNLAAAAVLGWAAALDYSAPGGRTNLCFTGFPALQPDVTSQVTASQLILNGANYYGAFGTTTIVDNVFFNGQITGEYDWADDYVNQILLASDLQNALLQYVTAMRSIPYTPAGYAGIRAACQGPINDALNFGSIVPGVALSPGQIAEVNAQAGGRNVAPVVQSAGWYLLVADPGATVRGARGSPVVILFYTTGESVQAINVSLIEVQ